MSSVSDALRELGIKKGDTIGVMAWDTIRYLEFFFTIPMMGAILHTINIRLSEQQILYTINHADDDILIVHHDFIQVIDKIRLNLRKILLRPDITLTLMTPRPVRIALIVEVEQPGLYTLGTRETLGTEGAVRVTVNGLPTIVDAIQ